MQDRPIIFSAPMVRALLAGRKMQTRRLLKPQPDQTSDPSGNGDWGRNNRFGYWRPAAELRDYKPGNRLWVRESHYLTDDGDRQRVVYAENAEEHLQNISDMQARYILSDTWAIPHRKLRPAIHMPRWASRLTLTITDVRVQKLQDISEADAVAEGCLMDPEPDEYGGLMPAEIAHESGIGDIGWDNAKDWYADLWDGIHGPNAWDANPWVSAISFTVAKVRAYA
jgi:hypothetical protein